jgi:copper transport protein
VLIAANLLLFIALLLLAGAAVARFLHRRTPGADESLAQRGRWLLRGGAALLLVGAIGRLIVTAQLLRDDGEPWGPLLLTVARETSAGRWTAGLAALAVMISATGVRWPGGAAFVGAMGTAIGLAFSGHASEIEPLALWVALDALHAFGALLWIGGLIAVIPALRHAQSGALLARFSPVALGGAALAVGSGVARAWTVIPSVDALRETTYGQLLMIKSGLVLVVLTLGWRNYRAHRHRLTLDSARSRHVQRRARVELAVAMVVIAVTAVLSTSAPSD